MAIPTVAASLKGCVKKGIKSQGCKNTNDLTLLQLHSQECLDFSPVVASEKQHKSSPREQSPDLSELRA